jgi:hypothetical protein
MEAIKRPPIHICPKEFCFLWREEGNSFAPGLYNNLDEALKHAKPVTESGCGCTFGVCIRNEKEKGEKDWYELASLNLKVEMPWFYFSDPQKLKRKIG